MSSSEPTIDVSIFLQLDMPVIALKNTFAGNPAFRDLLGQRVPEIAPGVSIGPPTLPIAQYKNTRIEYVGDRFLLKQNGPLQDLIELNEVLPSLLEKQNYSLDELVRFCEVDTRLNPMTGNGVVDWIRSNVKVDLRGLSRACGEELKVFAFWATNSDTPLTDEWLNITLQPDVNSSHKRLIWRIIKRTKTHTEISEFLIKMKSILNELGIMFSG